MRKLLISLFFLNSTVSTLCAEQVRFCNYESVFVTGEVVGDSTSVLTGCNGQLFLSDNNGLELRLKQDTSIKRMNEPLSCKNKIFLERGTLGVRVASETVLIRTPFAAIRTRNATIVLKVTDTMTRLCVLKGNAVLKQGTNFVSVNQNNEIAVAKWKVSSPYRFLDDLRYTWYWTTADKEPAFRE